MKKIIILLAVIASITIHTSGQTQEADDYQAVLVFEKNVADVGVIRRDTTGVNVEFKFTNTGNAPLVLNYVHPSCSCVSLSYTREPVAPGASGHISATLMPSTIHEQSFKRNIMVKSNAGKGVRLFIVGKFDD